MFDHNKYLEDLVSECKFVFGKRLLYVGLQGSYMRGEATEKSDIDVMLVLDRLSVSDMDEYRAILKKLGSFELSCGFICGRDELSRWNPLEICQLKHTTKDVFGSLSDFLPEFSRTDELNYCKLGLGDLYHGLCHRYIHAERERNIESLRCMGKPLFFLIQNLHYLESGDYILTKTALEQAVSEADSAMLARGEINTEADFDRAFSAVFAWCQSAFRRIEAAEKTEID